MNMTVVKLTLDEIHEDPQNARLHNKRNLDAIKNSLTKFTQYKPIVVQKSSMKIIAGNGTYQAARALGWETVEANIIDVDDATAAAIGLADNKTSDLSEWDNEVLNEVIKGLDQDLIEFTGFDDVEIADMFADDNNDVIEKDQDKQKEDSEKQDKQNNQIICSICKFPLVLADVDKVQKLNNLMETLKKSKDQQKKSEISDYIFDAIIEQLENNMIVEE